jgi:hypothetical protein
MKLIAFCAALMLWAAQLGVRAASDLATYLQHSTATDSGIQADEADDKPADSAKKEESKEKKDEGKEAKKIKPYDDVITKEAVTSVGLIHAHRIADKLFYEIPVDTLNLDLLWVTQISETTQGNSYAGMPVDDLVVRWEQKEDRIFLRRVQYEIRAETKDPIADAVRASNLAPIMKAFDVKAYGKDKAPVIEVTELFTKEVPEISARRSLRAGAIDSNRTFIQRVKAFPENVEVSVLASYAPGGKESEPSSSGPTATIHHSMVKLPDKPMKPRLHDSRVGFFNVSFVDYADGKGHDAPTVRYITRWRLEKKNPEAELSEPVKPIVFYVGREVPKKWQPYVKAGIEAWQPAFEAAGFKNAIIGKYAPDPREEPDWDPEDARISSIRWLPSEIENAFGPHVHDPRTGEILDADIRMFHNVQKLIRDWYFVQASACDPRAQKLPLPDDLMGELIQFVVAHEVGHSLGFPHNMKASSAYTVQQLRDPEWTKKNGTAPSIMDYARFNYVAQPGDGAALTPKIGPYDHFAATWGYRQFSAGTDEKAELEKLVKKQINDPIYRFGDPNAGVDSTQQTEDLGSDTVEATKLGLKNLERITGFLVSAASEPGKDYELLSNMYDALLAQWNREIGHVVNVIGGVKEVNLYYGDANQRFFPNDPEYQRAAAAFLIAQALTTPKSLIRPEIVLRLTATGVADRVLGAQQRVLAGLLRRDRIQRMTEHADAEGDKAYTPAKLLQELRQGVFLELSTTVVNIDCYRRNLQRAYVQQLADLLPKPAVDSDLSGLARAELMAIGKLVGQALDRPNTPEINAHLLDLKARIELALDPRGQGTRASVDR